MPSEFYEGPEPPTGYVKSPFQQCDIACIICRKPIAAHILVDSRIYPKGIVGVTEFLVKSHAAHVCSECIEKIGFKVGKLPQVENR